MNIKKIEIKGNHFLLTDTVTNDIEIQFASKDIYYKNDPQFVTFYTYNHDRVGDYYELFNLVDVNHNPFPSFAALLQFLAENIGGAGGSNGNVNGIASFSATNYTDLITNYPVAVTGTIAYVYNAQGTYPFTDKPAGYYVFDGSVWKKYTSNVETKQDIRLKLEENVIHSNISHTLTETLFSASNVLRTVLRISNETNVKLYIKYKAGITMTTHTFLLSRGDVAIIDDYNGAVYGVWFTTGIGNAVLSETII